MRIVLLAACLLSANSLVHSQDCKVLMGSISVSYTGDCKDKKANGKGIATGLDTYEGDFKAGYPDGAGKYTFKTGDWFEGNWKKGQKEGHGEMHYKREGQADSVLAGFWKRDVYLGRYEKPYNIIGQSSKVSTVKVTRNISMKEHDITINIESTSGGTNNVNGKPGQLSDAPLLKLTGVDIRNGYFNSQTDLNNSAKSASSILKRVEFPFKATFRISDEHTVEIEFLEEGNYQVDINILM